MRLAADAQKKPVENGGKTGRAGEDKRRDLQTEGTGSGKGTCGQRALRPKEDHRDKETVRGQQTALHRRKQESQGNLNRGGTDSRHPRKYTGQETQCWQSNRQTGAADGRK